MDNSRYDSLDQTLGGLSGLRLPAIGDHPAASTATGPAATPANAAPAPAPARPKAPTRTQLGARVTPETKRRLNHAARELAAYATLGEIVDELVATHLPAVMERIRDRPPMERTRNWRLPGESGE